MTSIKLDSAGDMVWPGTQESLIKGLPEIKQNVRCALKVIMGESFLDRSVGIPYFDGNRRNERTQNLILSKMKSAIEGVTGVVEVSYPQNINRSGGTLRATFYILCDTGETIMEDVNL